MTVDRAAVLGELAAKLSGISLGRPVRVAIDGRTASGKTTLADEIASLIRSKGYPVIRTSIDGFHRSKAERYARGRHSPEGYYYDARDLAAVRTLLLAPLGRKGIVCIARNPLISKMTCPSNRNRNWHQPMPFLLSMARFFSDLNCATAGI